MALSATVQWDVRTTGSDTNGGAFDPGVTSPGTDYSQQNSAQVVFTDLVIGTTNTQLTSALNPFTSAYVGNVINITSGTGFTTGRYEVKSVSGSTATMDRAVGTASSTGGNGNLGGSMATPTAAAAAIVSGNTIWMKAGTYTITSAVTQPTSTSFALQGYSASHGDNLAGAIITTSTASTDLIFVSNSSPVAWINNIALSSTAGSPGVGVYSNNLSDNLILTNVSITGCSQGVNIGDHSAVSLHMFNCAVINSTGVGIYTQAPTAIIKNCFVRGNSGIGIQLLGASVYVHISRSVIVDNGGVGGIEAAASSSGTTLEIVDCTIGYNSSHGVNLANGSSYLSPPFSFTAQNNILYGNGGWGIYNNVAGVPSVASVFMYNNAYGGNTSGNLDNLPAGPGDVTLTAVPFTSHSTGDYSLNSTAGGGAACKGVGYPGIFPGGLTTGHLDIGAVQSSGGGGGTSGGSYAFVG